MITKAQLIADGCVRNPNMWLGPSWFFCKGCEQYAYHTAFSHPGAGDCYELCLQCNEYHGNLQLKGAPMSVASDILEQAKRLNDVYLAGMKQAAQQEIPSRVYVLLQSGVVLGVLSREDKAIEQAYSLMESRKSQWTTLSANRIWRSDLLSVIVEISAHDVR